jgi:hypothetical protein
MFVPSARSFGSGIFVRHFLSRNTETEDVLLAIHHWLPICHVHTPKALVLNLIVEGKI